MNRLCIFISGLFGMNHSPLRPWLESAQEQWPGQVSGCDYDSPSALLDDAHADELIVIAHSFGVSRLFRDGHMLGQLPVRLRCYCIDGVQAWGTDQAISTQPNPLAQLGRPPFTALPNMTQVQSWRRQIDPISALFPFALSSAVVGANVTDTEVTNGMAALALLGSIFAGPAGATVADVLGGLVSHNSLVAAVMPKVMSDLATLMGDTDSVV